MSVKAVARHVRIAPRKARAVIDLVRGKPVEEARSILRFTPKRGAEIVEKVLNSAVANAMHNENMDETLLYVAEAFVDQGVTLKRWRARAQGSAAQINKRTSHVTVAVDEREEV